MSSCPWSRVDFERRLVRIWSDATGDDEEDDETADDDDPKYEVKSSEREITLSDGLIVALKAQRLRVGKSDWVFPVRTNTNGLTKGQRYAGWPKRTWASVITRASAMAKAADPKARPIVGGPHRLRHSFASHFLAAKPDLFALGRVLGHSHSRVTELYSHLLPDHLATTRNVVTFGVAEVGGAVEENPTQAPPKPHNAAHRTKARSA